MQSAKVLENLIIPVLAVCVCVCVSICVTPQQDIHSLNYMYLLISYDQIFMLKKTY